MAGFNPHPRSMWLKAWASALAKLQSDRQVMESDMLGSGPFLTKCGAMTGTNIAFPGVR